MRSLVRHSIPLLVVMVLGAPGHAADRPEPVQYAEKWTITSRTFDENRDLFVATPAGYDGGTRRYPVLYLTDGDGHLLQTAATARFLADTGWIPELIVVGVAQGDRMRELTPTRGKPLPWPGGVMRDFPTAGGADQFLEFVVSEVIPFVEENYRTQPCRILAGHSAGGLFATHAMLQRPDAFDSFIAASAAFRWDDEWIVKKADRFFGDRESFHKTFFMTIGDEPISRPSWDRFRNVLEAATTGGFRWDALVLEEENHPSVALRSYYFGLRKVFEDWPVPRNEETGDYVGGLPGVIAHYRSFSERHGYEVPPPEIVLYILGARARAKDDLDVAIEAFALASQTYPDVALLHDRFGDALEAAGREHEARRAYARAVEVGTKNHDPRLSSYQRNLERLTEKTEGTEGDERSVGRQNIPDIRSRLLRDG